MPSETASVPRSLADVSGRGMRSCYAALAALFLINVSGALSAQEPHVREIILPEGAADVSYSKSRGDVRATFPGDMTKAGEFYRVTLAQQQWTKSTKDNVQKAFWVQTFTKQNRELEVRVSNREGGCDIRVTPKGFLWDEDFSPRPEDLPVPDGAQDLKYDDLFSVIEFLHDHTPRQLVDFYASKLDPKTWKKSREDSVRDDSGIVHRSSGVASILIYIDAEGGKTKVKINTKGMSWDAIKVANAKAKREVAEPAPKPVAGGAAPKRFNKPNRGIEKLEKLPSVASVTIDGKKTPLPEIFAYELIAYGKWRTHVVATAQPVKQDVLLQLLRSNVPEEKWGDRWQLPSPNVVLVLDEDDSLWSMMLYADKVPGSATELVGEAVVEAGRARGQARLKPQKFFEHSYEAEMSFDTPLINPSAAPRKLLAGVAPLPNAGSIVLGEKTHPLTHVIAYEERDDKRSVIRVVLTEKPIDAAKIRASLERSGEVGQGLIGFQAQLSIAVNESDLVSSIFIWCDGASLNWSGRDTIKSSVQSDGDRIRGTIATTAKEDVFGKSCEFQASFDTTIIRAPRSK